KLEGVQKKLELHKKKDQGQYEGASDDLTVAKAWLAHADDAVRLLRTIADKEEGEAEASQGIPAHEMIADMLLEAKHPEQALAEYEATLKTNPGRFNSLRCGAGGRAGGQEGRGERILFPTAQEL